MGSVLNNNLHADWMRETRAYTFTNESDGSFWNESQLRVHFTEYLNGIGACQSPRCRRVCYALPGDTLIWSAGDFYLEVRAFRTASQQELADRGYLEGPGGILSQYCQLARNDPSQLEANDQSDGDEDAEEE